VGTLLYYGQKAVREPHDKLVSHGAYVTLEDSQVWLQCLSILIVLYFSWTPLSCSCFQPAVTFLRRKSGFVESKVMRRSNPQGLDGGMAQEVDSDDDIDDDQPLENPANLSPDQLYVPPDSM